MFRNRNGRLAGLFAAVVTTFFAAGVVMAAPASAAASGGGVTWSAWGSYGTVGSGIYQGASKQLWPNGRITIPSNNPTATSATMKVELCRTSGLYSPARCESVIGTQVWDIKGSYNAYTCTLVRGGPTGGGGCSLYGLGYTPVAGKWYLTRTTVTINGVSKTVNSPVQVAG